MKRKTVITVMLMAFMLCACGGKQTASETMPTVEKENGDSNSRAIAAQDEVIEKTESDKNEQKGLCVTKESDGSITVALSDDKLELIKDGASELWLRLYFDDNREGGYEISSDGSNWAMNRIGENGVVAEGTELERSGKQWIFSIGEDAASDLEVCTYYEAIFKDWNNDDNTIMFADGNYAIEKSQQQAVTENTEREDISDDTQNTAQSTAEGYWFLDTKLLDIDGGWLKLYGLNESGMPTRLAYSMYGYEYDFALKNVSISVNGDEYTIEGTVCEFGKDKIDAPLYIFASGDGGIGEGSNQFVMDSPAKEYYYIEGKKDKFLF